jgi:hypothetical protein
MFFMIACQQPGEIRAPGICGRQQVYRVMIGKGYSVSVLAALSAFRCEKPLLQMLTAIAHGICFFHSWLRKG